jgi:hypothetical protein
MNNEGFRERVFLLTAWGRHPILASFAVKSTESVIMEFI